MLPAPPASSVEQPWSQSAGLLLGREASCVRGRARNPSFGELNPPRLANRVWVAGGWGDFRRAWGSSQGRMDSSGVGRTAGRCGRAQRCGGPRRSDGRCRQCERNLCRAACRSPCGRLRGSGRRGDCIAGTREPSAEPECDSASTGEGSAGWNGQGTCQEPYT